MFEPNPQNRIRTSDFESIISSYDGAFKRIYKALGFNCKKVKQIAELGCGRGPIVQAALNVFSNAHIHAVDPFDILEKGIKENRRVTFYPNKIVDLLGTGQLPQLDAAVLRGTENSHGLDNSNIVLLVDSLSSSGLLITDYDNGDVEGRDWFRKKFKLVYGKDANWGLRVWKII